jgi:hypothetical protein
MFLWKRAVRKDLSLSPRHPPKTKHIHNICRVTLQQNKAISKSSSEPQRSKKKLDLKEIFKQSHFSNKLCFSVSIFIHIRYLPPHLSFLSSFHINLRNFSTSSNLSLWAVKEASLPKKVRIQKDNNISIWSSIFFVFFWPLSFLWNFPPSTSPPTHFSFEKTNDTLHSFLIFC